MRILLDLLTTENIKWLLFYSWKPVVEIFVIAIIVYTVASLVRGTRTAHLLKGLMIIILAFLAAQILQLHTINWLLTKVFAFSMIAFLIIFQPELRRMLAKLGQKTLFMNLLQEESMVEEIAEAAGALSKKRIGALIVIEQNVGLRNYIESGIALDSKITHEMLVSIFMPQTPLHDGAVIVQGQRISAAGCLLPLTENPDITRSLGTRHRAAIGITEETDAVVVVVSEETGVISLVIGGNVTRNLDVDGLNNALAEAILTDENDAGDKAEDGPRTPE